MYRNETADAITMITIAAAVIPIVVVFSSWGCGVAVGMGVRGASTSRVLNPLNAGV